MRVRYRLFFLISLILLLTWPVPAMAQSGGPGQPLVHIVQRGETLFSIARRYGTTVDAITHANGIPDPRRIYVGQRLTIPGAPVLADAWSTHVVRAGESLEAVAAQYGLPWRTVALANRLLNPHLLSVGQVLRVPAEGGRAYGGALHVVQPGETPLSIAFRHGLSLWELLEANGFIDPASVFPGQHLFIPGERPDWMPAPFETVELDPVPVLQGQAFRVAVRTEEPVTLAGTVFDRPVQFAEEDGVYYALVGVHALADPGLYELTLTATTEGGEQAALSVGVVVEDGGYGYERIDVPPSRANLLDPALVAAERERLNQVRYLFTPTRRWHGPFLPPVEAAISSYFGTRRSYNGGPYNSYHAGVDFDAGMGTPVHAPADGVVVLAEPLAVRGNAVVLDHGWGVLTGYWHLSSIEVSVGQEVRAGDVIGRVGSTGLSTGAHLHWEVWVGGVSVSGLQWLAPTYPWSDLEGGGAGAAEPGALPLHPHPSLARPLPSAGGGGDQLLLRHPPLLQRRSVQQLPRRGGLRRGDGHAGPRPRRRRRRTGRAAGGAGQRGGAGPRLGGVDRLLAPLQHRGVGGAGGAGWRRHRPGGEHRPLHRRPSPLGGLGGGRQRERPAVAGPYLPLERSGRGRSALTAFHRRRRERDSGREGRSRRRARCSSRAGTRTRTSPRPSAVRPMAGPALS